MKYLMTLLGLLFFGLAAAQTQQQVSFDKLKQDAEKLYAEKSYAQAYDLYSQAATIRLTTTEARWVKFRLADTLWRAQSGTNNSDSTKEDQAQAQLETVIKDVAELPEKDSIWAEAHQSLAEFWWTRRNSRNWQQAWPHYQAALDWWAGSPDIESARGRYLKLIWSLTEPPTGQAYYYYGNYGGIIPLPILDNALRIAQVDRDKARLHYLIGMGLMQQGGNWESYHRIPEEFEAALATGKGTVWYQDALMQYAGFMERTGNTTLLDNGQWQNQPDYVKALELYRRLVREFSRGETQYYQAALNQIRQITTPTVGVNAANIFLPGSEIQVQASWHNVKQVRFSVHRVNLTNDLRSSNSQLSQPGWVNLMSLEGAEVQSWTKETGDKGDYTPGQENIRLPEKLSIGAYIIEATGAGAASHRDLLLITDASLVIKTSGTQALAYFCNALDGAPIANSKVRFRTRTLDNDGRTWHSWDESKETNKDGIAVVNLPRTGYSDGLLVSAANDNRQAFSFGSYGGYGTDHQPWRIYAMTDRPAYQPKETVQWKFIARQYNGEVYSTPANQTIEYQIDDPRGTKVTDGKLTLNAFGSVWGTLELDEKLPLGMYRVTFWAEGRHTGIGNAELFRLEEYKLPEFKISVQTAEENGKKKAFRLGDQVEAKIQADYYFGGPVPNANVEVVIYQTPFYHYYFQPREYSWFYNDFARNYNNYGGQIIKRESIKTDISGKATLTFDTPAQGQDMEYRIEARVTDSSRREIVGSNSIRVTNQRYYVNPSAAHNIFRPQDKVVIDLKSLDANDQPVEVEGKVIVTRDYWEEIWVDPAGREVKGLELSRLRSQNRVFPPPAPVGGRGWSLKVREYQHDQILAQDAKTDNDGNGQVNFIAPREGYYHLAWHSRDKSGMPINAETMVWVANNASSDLGYRQGGLEIVIDKDTFRAGQTATVMLTGPVSDRYALFSIEGSDLYSYQLVHLTGTVKLIEIPLTEKHTPNIFLSAVMVNQGQMLYDSKQVIVPPVNQFLNVDVKADRNQYQPQESGTLTVKTTDKDGRPVAAEVALGVTDESVSYIQHDLAGDPRQFYYGSKRAQQVQLHSTFQQKSYVKLVEGPAKQLVDDNERTLSEINRRDQYVAKDEKRAYDGATGGRIGGVPGGMVGGVSGAINMELDGVNVQDNLLKSSDGFFTRLQSQQIVTLTAANLAALPDSAPFAGTPEQKQREAAVQVRHDFRSTVLWRPDVVTDKNGTAVIKVKYPDSLTTWSTTARVSTAGNKFGIGTSTTRTEQPLIVRLQAPRFFVVGDQVTVSAVINNNTDKPMTVRPALNAKGLEVKGLVSDEGAASGPIQVAPRSEARVDWAVGVQEPGAANIKVTAVTASGDQYADAMERSYPIYEHGLEKLVAKSGKLRSDDVTVRLDIPKERKPESTRLTVQIAPSMTVTMLDALPYLLNYPYGCTEQTMSRFLPAAITAKTLKDQGLQPELVMGRLFGGIEQASANQTHSHGKMDLRQLEAIETQGLERLYDFQHGDGGWGWWKEGNSDRFMTAYVIWGMALARNAGINIRDDAFNRGIDYLDKTLVEEINHYDEQAWMLQALAAGHAANNRHEVSRFQAAAFTNLWDNRDKLNAYTRALLALSAHYYGYQEQAKVLIGNLENGVKKDSSPDTSIIQTGAQASHDAVIGTAHWGEDGLYWRWSDGGVEATAFALRALVTIDPNNKLIEPIVNWLVKNRRGAQWRDTRDTAITVLALNDYLRISGEAKPNIEYELLVNGHSIASQKLTTENAFSAPSQFAIDSKYINDGSNEIRLRRKSGDGPLYFSAQAAFFSLEEPITAAGNELFVRRDYYKLVSRPTLLKGITYDRQPLRDGETVNSGDRVEVIVTVEAKNNYEYLLFEDLKPAGLEAVQIQSGSSVYAQELKADGLRDEKVSGQGISLKVANVERNSPGSASPYTGRMQWVYQELRDRKVALFIDKLPQGVWELRYTLRAETPGHFHALPIVAEAMYVPEIRANGVEQRIFVKDK